MIQLALPGAASPQFREDGEQAFRVVGREQDMTDLADRFGAAEAIELRGPTGQAAVYAGGSVSGPDSSLSATPLRLRRRAAFMSHATLTAASS